MVTKKGRVRAKKSWATRRKRYGKDGVMNTKADVIETQKHIMKGPQRRRPATHFFMGDQIRPLSQSKAGMKQWKRTVIVDVQRPGTEYEVWERTRVQRKGFPKGLDRWVNEWAHMKDPKPKGKIKLLKKVM